MKKIFLLFIFFSSLILSGCAGTTQPDEKQFLPLENPQNKNFLLGTAGYFPKNGTNATPDELQEFWQETNLISDLHGVHTDWKETRIVDSALKNTQLDLVVGLGFENSDEWKNNVDDYIQTAKKILQNDRVKYLFYANEVNKLKQKTGNDFGKFLDVSKKIYTELKTSFPEKKIFVTFQYESLIGKGYLMGGTNPNDLELIKSFNSSTDFIGITTYPMFDFTDPEDIPTDYYDKIKSYSDKKIAFTEIGWLSRNLFPAELKELEKQGYTGSEDEQISFLERFIEITQNLDVEFANWISLHDWTDWRNKSDTTNDTVLFESLGLKYFTGEPKKSWYYFGSLQNLPLKND